MTAIFAVATVFCCGVAEAAPITPFQMRLGVRPRTADEGACVVKAPHVERHCTLSQSDQRIEYWNGYGSLPEVAGHLVRFTVNAGAATPATASVRVRLHVLAGPFGPGRGVGAWHELSLRTPGRPQTFAADLRYLPGDQIGLDVEVRRDGSGEAAAPLAVREVDPRTGIFEWTPPLNERTSRFPHTKPDRYLSLEAIYERDDREAPRLHLAYARRQDFLRERRVVVDVISDEAAAISSSGLIHLPARGRYAFWGYVDEEPGRVRAGVTRRLVFRVTAAGVHAANVALRRGQPVVFVIQLRAVDAAGNKRVLDGIRVRPVVRR